MEIILTDENFDQQVNHTDKAVLVDFFATWCGPCGILGPTLEKIAEEFSDKLVLLKADVDKTPIASQKFQVEKIPTVVLFKNGKPVNGFVGIMSEQSIKDWLKNIL